MIFLMKRRKTHKKRKLFTELIKPEGNWLNNALKKKKKKKKQSGKND